MAENIGVPSVGGFKHSMVSYAYGAGGGLIYSLFTGIMGNGLLGSLVSAGLAGSVIKGTKGEIIATVLGFNGIVASMGSGAASVGASEETM